MTIRHWNFNQTKQVVNSNINVAADEVPLGTCCKNVQLVVKEEAVDSDSLIPIDKRIMEVLREIGNSINPSIQLEVDYPSNHEDGKKSILDLKVWVQEIDGNCTQILC